MLDFNELMSFINQVIHTDTRSYFRDVIGPPGQWGQQRAASSLHFWMLGLQKPENEHLSEAERPLFPFLSETFFVFVVKMSSSRVSEQEKWILGHLRSLRSCNDVRDQSRDHQEDIRQVLKTLIKAPLNWI